MTQESDQKQHRVAAFFDREAARFPIVHQEDASWLSRLGNTLFRRSLRLRYDRVMAECAGTNGARVLDIGCGPGTYSIALAQTGAQSVVGIDLAPGMVEIAQKRATQAGVGRRCEFVVSSMDDYEATSPFDFVIAMGIMDYIEETARFIESAASLTAQKAFFSFPKKKGFLVWQRRLRYRRRCPLWMYDRGDLDDLFGPLGDYSYTVESIARDWLVILKKNPHL